MKIITVRVEDNTEKIKEVQKSNAEKLQQKAEMMPQIEALQKEKFAQILAYIKCMYEDFISLDNSNRMSINRFTVCIRIVAHHVYIDFNYSGTPNCKNTPPRMEAVFHKDNIEILSCSYEGMIYWSHIKPMFQRMIEEEYERVIITNQKEIAKWQHMKAVAENFQV